MLIKIEGSTRLTVKIIEDYSKEVTFKNQFRCSSFS